MRGATSLVEPFGRLAELTAVLPRDRLKDRMPAILAPHMPVPSAPQFKRIPALTASFWLFSYSLLALRKILDTDDWSVALSAQRVIAVSVGAFAYWLVLKQIEAGLRIRLRTVIGWILVATLAMLILRIGLSNLLADGSVPLSRSMRWTLTWGAYFGLWVIGAIAFAPARAAGAVPARPILSPVSAATAKPSTPAATADDLVLVINAIADEVAELDSVDRMELAGRVLRLGGYEVAGDDSWARSQTARARFAAGLAARLARG